MASAVVSVAGGARFQAVSIETIGTTSVHLPQDLELETKYVCASKYYLMMSMMVAELASICLALSLGNPKL